MIILHLFTLLLQDSGTHLTPFKTGNYSDQKSFFDIAFNYES